MIGVAVGIGGIGLLALGQIQSHQTQANPGTAPLATNWVGYLALGVEESIDRIAPKPGVFPVADPRVEIGLRSDGLVVWRKAAMAR